ncbi:outer membrane beta-barrel protein [Mucilaginibacter segetis]|uniref:Outer membrane protein beta-barrel domain-containing protein n=1 Tax=Mucilaginibacter segetis TaxID=2793071 RepID=A0A934UMD4_9SPHI|nr:outer membrane beta-barrel protein [Mucilaginibacter segetis]MBK0378772.1 hypothetical protein [Mucilaginibacter segetis]
MKTTTKLIATAFTAVALFFGTNVKAQNAGGDSQNRVRLGIGLEAGVPTGNLHDFSNFSLGGTARLQYDIKSNVSLMLTSGYYNFFSKNASTSFGGVTYTADPKDQGMVPVKAGVKIFYAPSWYISAEAGAGFETQYAKDTKLILSPGIGYASDSGWDVGVRYENFSGQDNNYGLVGLRVAYAFL